MTGCEDDLVGELQSMARILGEQADRNRRQADEDFGGQGQDPIPDPGEFQALPWLTVPFRGDDAGERPLPSRPEGDPPIPGFNPGVYDDSGKLVREVSAREPYELRCRVRNPGDQHVASAKVEFFVEHRPLTATVDATEGRVLAPAGREAPVTGFTTARPGAGLQTELEVVDDTGDTTRYIGDTATVTDDRTFSANVPFDRVEEGEDAAVVIYSTVRNRPLGSRAVKLVDVDDPPDNRGPLALGAKTDAVEFVGRTRVRVAAGDSTTTEVEYVTPDPGSLPAGVKEPYGPQQLVVYARVYAMAPIDAPNDWGVLDLRPDRHVGRSEVFWA